MCNETEIVDKKKNTDEENEEGGKSRNDEVGESLVEGANKIRDVESPKERGQTATFGETFDNTNEGGRRGLIVMDSIL